MEETQLTLKDKNIVSVMKNVQKKIVSVRGVNVILDADVANLYGVETRRINEAVKNNPDKFPADYTFTLTPEEVSILRSNFSTANLSTKARVLPHAFTEKGLYMLATILKSKTATSTTIAIIETFSAVRELKRELLALELNFIIGKIKHTVKRIKRNGD